MAALPAAAFDLPAGPNLPAPVARAAGPVPDTFVTAIRRSWMVPVHVKTCEPSPTEVASLVEKSYTWSDHDRAQECVRICHKHPLLWQEFLFQERVEKKRRERNAKRAREMADIMEGNEKVLREKQQLYDLVTRQFIYSSNE